MIFSLPCQSAIKNIQPLEKYGRSAHPHTPQTSTGWIFIPLTCRPATEITQPMGNTDADDPLTRHKHPASGGFAPLRGTHSKCGEFIVKAGRKRPISPCDVIVAHVITACERYSLRNAKPAINGGGSMPMPLGVGGPPRRGPSRREASGMNLLPNPCCYRRFSSPFPFPWTPLPFPSAKA